MRLMVATAISHGHVFCCLGLGPESRIHMLRNLLMALVRHERIEATWVHVDKMSGYAEKLIDYGKLGDTNQRAMRMADFWITEEDLMPKLFQVLASRYQGQSGGYTRMLQIPNRNERDRAKMAVIKFKGNCLPPLPLPHRDSTPKPAAAGPGTVRPQLPHSSDARVVTVAKEHILPSIISGGDLRP